MRIAEVVGTVTLAHAHPAMQGASLRLVVPLSSAELRSGEPGRTESLVAWDPHGAGLGARVALSEGSEAAQPFQPEPKPVDAYCAAILDNVHLDAVAE